MPSSRVSGLCEHSLSSLTATQKTAQEFGFWSGGSRIFLQVKLGILIGARNRFYLQLPSQLCNPYTRLQRKLRNLWLFEAGEQYLSVTQTSGDHFTSFPHGRSLQPTRREMPLHHRNFSSTAVTNIVLRRI